MPVSMAAMAEWKRQAVGVAGHQLMTLSAREGPRTVLLVHGEHDTIVLALVLFPGCSNLPFIEDPERCLHTVNLFIQDTADQVLSGLP